MKAVEEKEEKKEADEEEDETGEGNASDSEVVDFASSKLGTRQ
jgi:hypothetical protein